MDGRIRKYTVHLTAEARERLEAITRNGSAPAKKIQHARVLLRSDAQHLQGGYQDQEIAAILSIHANTVARVRTRFVQQGEGPALERKVRVTPPVASKLDGHGEALLVAICCSPAPEGQRRWTLSLLQQELTGRKIVTSISRETIRLTLKKCLTALANPAILYPGAGRGPLRRVPGRGAGRLCVAAERGRTGRQHG